MRLTLPGNARASESARSSLALLAAACSVVLRRGRPCCGWAGAAGEGPGLRHQGPRAASTAGAVVLRVRNDGPDTHELILVRADGRAAAAAADNLTIDEDALKPRTVSLLDDALPGTRARLEAAPRTGPLRALLQHVRALPRRHARAARRPVIAAREVVVQAVRHARPRHDHRDHRDVRAVLGASASASRSARRRARATARPSSRSQAASARSPSATCARRCCVQRGGQADPATTAQPARDSAERAHRRRRGARVNGDDDETALPAATGLARRQLMQARRLVNDLTATGSAWLAGRPLDAVKLTANEKVDAARPGTSPRGARGADLERLARTPRARSRRAPTAASRG